MAKTKKQIQRETRRKKTTLKGRKKASMRGGQSKYIFPESLKLGYPNSDFTDITSDEIFKKMSSQNYPKFYEELKRFTITLYNKITNKIRKPDNNIRHHCEENVFKNSRSVSENRQSPNQYDESPNQYDDLREPIKGLNEIELFAFLSHLLDYLKIEQDGNCEELKYGRITCKCYNKKHKKHVTKESLSNYSSPRTLRKSILSTEGTNLSNYHRLDVPPNLEMLGDTSYNRLNKNPSRKNSKYSGLSGNPSQSRRPTESPYNIVNNPLYKGNNPYYSEPRNIPGNNHVYESIPNILGNENTIYENQEFADMRLENNKDKSPYFTKLKQQANATYGNAQKTLEKSVARKNQEYKKNRLHESSKKVTKKKGFLGRAANAIKKGLPRTRLQIPVQ